MVATPTLQLCYHGAGPVETYGWKTSTYHNNSWVVARHVLPNHSTLHLPFNAIMPSTMDTVKETLRFTPPTIKVIKALLWLALRVPKTRKP